MMFSREDRATLARIETKLNLLLNLENQQMEKVDAVLAAIDDLEAEEDKEIALLDQVTALLKDARSDPSKLDAALQKLADAKAKLTSAEGRDAQA